MIGESPTRADALGKVTGAARYPGDLVRPGMLHLAVVPKSGERTVEPV